MKASERSLHVSRLSDRINQSAAKGCRKGLQERAVIGTKHVPEFIIYIAAPGLGRTRTGKTGKTQACQTPEDGAAAEPAAQPTQLGMEPDLDSVSEGAQLLLGRCWGRGGPRGRRAPAWRAVDVPLGRTPNRWLLAGIETSV